MYTVHMEKIIEAVGEKSREIFITLIDEIKPVFRTRKGEERAAEYLLGLCSDAERKNSWQIAEYTGETTPYALQQFLYRGRWSADELRDKLQGYVKVRFGEEDAVMVIDETGFLKQGKKSCGVKRQYSGTAGRIENCQIGVFLTYVSSTGSTLVDRELYIPEEWISDMDRRAAAGVPEDCVFRTKPQMAADMLAHAQHMPFAWVSGDSVYGSNAKLRAWCEENSKNYVMAISGKEYVWQGLSQNRVSNIVANLKEEAWISLSCGNGSKGERLYQWQCMPINSPDGYRKRRLMFRRKDSQSTEIQAYICYAPEDVPLEKLVEIAGVRWNIETNFAQSKSEVGLDQYEVRSYDGWYKHITLACLALALLSFISSISLDTKTLQAHKPGSSSLDAFKRGRNLRV